MQEDDSDDDDDLVDAVDEARSRLVDDPEVTPVAIPTPSIASRCFVPSGCTVCCEKKLQGVLLPGFEQLRCCPACHPVAAALCCVLP